MILVKTNIKPSAIAGIGLFANQNIPKGTAIWKFQGGFDLSIYASELSTLSEPAKEQFLNYAYLNPKTNKYILCFDDARFFNHSDDPNCIEIESLEDGEGINIAARDILEGEELTCDYRVFDADFSNKGIIE
ncbi:MAG: SET domain-containing protein [Patescibacteria group bacterium]